MNPRSKGLGPISLFVSAKKFTAQGERIHSYLWRLKQARVEPSVLSRSSTDKHGSCYDKDPECSQDVCRNYPYTAKERCPKFCGLCSDLSSSRSSDHLSSKFSSSHQQSSSLKSGIIESSTIDKGDNK
ncbi:hypothetical protein LOAG_17825 [Loa loa]|uniref:ShKT domain-containing protein n=1 Tax=Loa loa TaxID=7209 RepID=A0A1S0UGV6_LOALO|nr:hypothetical protein LOAG_17825 [Loa loa]EJD74930.1 hypothetical protein LOAG_17825 [Loa loa]